VNDDFKSGAILGRRGSGEGDDQDGHERQSGENPEFLHIDLFITEIRQFSRRGEGAAAAAAAPWAHNYQFRPPMSKASRFAG
jgi:hypothetical protein